MDGTRQGDLTIVPTGWKLTSLVDNGRWYNQTTLVDNGVDGNWEGFLTMVIDGTWQDQSEIENGVQKISQQGQWMKLDKVSP